MRLTSFDNTQIYYERTDNQSKTHLVLLHGLGGDSHSWESELKIFWEKGFSTITIDLRGHGMSERPKDSEGYALISYAKDVCQVVKTEKITHFTLVGHCFGGIVGLVFAGLYPGQTKALILVDTSYKAPFISISEPYSKYMQMAISWASLLLPGIHLQGHENAADFIGTSDFNIRRIINDIAHMSIKSYLLIWKNLISYDATTWLKKITVPTLIIEGANDSIVPPQVAQELQKRIVNSQLKLIPGANHIIVLNNPKKLTDEVIKFLRVCIKT